MPKRNHQKVTVEYSANNSGGDWWLTDRDWKELEEAGWKVRWYSDMAETDAVFKADKDGRWMGALATKATKEFPSEEEGIAEWERITGQYANDPGCHCCGRPHYFSS